MRTSSISAFVVFLLMTTLATSSSAEVLRVAVQGSFGTATIGRGEDEDEVRDFPDADLPQSEVGAGGMFQLAFNIVDGFHLGAYFDYKTSSYNQSDITQFVLKVPAVGLVARVSKLPIIIQVAAGYSFGTGTLTTEEGSSTDDMIGIQAQFWFGYEIPVVDWFSVDLGLFFTYDGLNFTDDYQPDRDIKKGPYAQILTYQTYGLGAQLNFDVF